jgi:hypothetical protein
MATPRSHYRKAADEELLPLIRRLVDERPTSSESISPTHRAGRRQLSGSEPVA